MRVAWINPPFLPNYSRGQRSPAVTRSGTLYYPLWLAYGACHTIRLGHETILIDAPAEKLDAPLTIERIKKFSPELAFVETATPSIENDLEFAKNLKATLPSCRVFACGTHASALPQESLALCPTIDGIIIGEFEIPCEEIIKALSERKNIDGLEGVYTGKNQPPPRSRYFENLDARPFVSEIYKKFLPIPRYFNPNAHHPMVAIFTGRGCPFSCSFCVFPQTISGRRYRKRSVESILEEFKWVAENLPFVRGIFIEDDTFTADQKRATEFSRQLAKLNLPLTWTANARADLDSETLQAMKSAKLRALCVGFESGDQKLLDAIGKGNTITRMEKFALDAHKAGIKLHGCFMVGLPGETRETLQKTLQFALRMPLDTAQFYPLMVYPGTKAYEYAKNSGTLAVTNFRDWLSPEGLHRCVVKTAELSPRKLVKFCNLARRRFYLRKSYIWNIGKKIIFDRDERNRVMRSAQTFLKHLLWDE